MSDEQLVSMHQSRKRDQQQRLNPVSTDFEVRNALFQIQALALSIIKRWSLTMQVAAMLLPLDYGRPYRGAGFAVGAEDAGLIVASMS